MAAVESSSKNRLAVLLIHGAGSKVDVDHLQDRLGDLAWVYEVKPGGGSRQAVDKVEAWMSLRKWDAVYFDLGHEDIRSRLELPSTLESVRRVASRLLAYGTVCLWGTANFLGEDITEPEAVAYNDGLRRSLASKGVVVFDTQVLGRIQAADRVLGRHLSERLAEVMIEKISERKTAALKLPAESRQRLTRLLKDDHSLADPDSLPEPPRRDALVFRADALPSALNLHPYLAYHDGRFWCIWASGALGTAQADQCVRYSTSTDGVTWEPAQILAADPDGGTGPWHWIASGLMVVEGRLTAFATLNRGRVQDKIWADAQVERFVWKSGRWTRQGILAKNCVIYYPPLRVAGRDFLVWRNPEAHFATAVWRADIGTWEVNPLPGPFPDYRMSEATHYIDPEGYVHLVIRDQGASGFVYHTVSQDAGSTWATPVKTNLPDAMSKNFADRLSRGWYYFINNSKNTGAQPRDCLTIVFSRDGWSYEQPQLLRKEAPAVRYPAGSKGTHSYQHAHAIEQAGRLWVAYATNMEDIEVSSCAIEDFKLR